MIQEQIKFDQICVSFIGGLRGHTKGTDVGKTTHCQVDSEPNEP